MKLRNNQFTIAIAAIVSVLLTIFIMRSISSRDTMVDNTPDQVHKDELSHSEEDIVQLSDEELECLGELEDSNV